MRTVRVEATGARRRRRSEPRLTIEGPFDLGAAARAAAAARSSARLTLDLRTARRVDDAALAALIREAAGCRVRVLGLSRHHERLLRYLAEDAAPGGRRPDAG